MRVLLRDSLNEGVPKLKVADSERERVSPVGVTFRLELWESDSVVLEVAVVVDETESDPALSLMLIESVTLDDGVSDTEEVPPLTDVDGVMV